MLEREARRKAAEERRAAVVERLRLQAEMEERRKLEAAEALVRIAEEKQRVEQLAIDRLASDRSQMTLEDELSKLYEQDCREIQEKKLFLQAEKERLAKWEREMRAKIREQEELLRQSER